MQMVALWHAHLSTLDNLTHTLWWLVKPQKDQIISTKSYRISVHCTQTRYQANNYVAYTAMQQWLNLFWRQIIYLRWIIIFLRRIKSSTYKSHVQTNCGPKFVSSDNTSVRTAGRWIKWRRCASAVKTNFGSKFTSFISTSTWHARRKIKWRKIWGQNSSKHWIHIYCSRFICDCLRRIIRLRESSFNMTRGGGDEDI